MIVGTIEQWAEYLTATGASANTVRLRVRTITALTNHAGVADPLRLNRQNAIAFLARDIRPWSRLTYWSGIKAWSAYVREFDIDLTYDLLRGVTRPPTPDGLARPINDDVIDALLELKLTPRPRAYVTLALFAALRVHEIAKIRGEDADLVGGWLMVTGKGGRTKPVPMHPEVLKLAASQAEFGFWFPSRIDPAQSVSPLSVSQTIGGALRQVGCTATAHQLRDTAATQLQRRVKDIRVTQTMLRHRSIQSTMKYTGVADDSMQAAVRELHWGPKAA